jgi:tetratricopeptide (TPR) repeat protein
MLKKSIYIALVFIGLLFFVAIGEVFADASAELEQAKSNILSLMQQGNFTEAEVQTQKLLIDFSSHKGTPQGLYDIAYRYHDVIRDNEALKLHQYNVEHFPQSMYAMWSQVEITYYHIIYGNNAAADAAFDKLLTVFSQQPTLPKEIYQVAKMYNKFGRPDKALALHQYNLKHFPKSMYAMWSQVELVYSHISDGDDAAADAAFDELTTVFANQETLPKEINQIAQRYNDYSKPDKALKLHQYNVEHFPQSMYAMWSQVRLVYSHVSNGNNAAADAAFDKLLTVFSQQPTLPEEVYKIAIAYSNAGRSEKAQQLYQYAVDNPSKTEDAIWAKASVVQSNILLGNEAAAQAALDSLITDFKDNPDLPMAIIIVGEQYYKQGLSKEDAGLADQAKDHFQKAVKIWDRLINELPDSASVPEACCWAGDCYLKLGKYQESIQRFQKVVDNYPQYKNAGHAQFMVGRCFEGLKDTGAVEKSVADAKIKAAYQQVIQNYPDCPAAEYVRNWLSREVGVEKEK